MDRIITLDYGGGGRKTSELIEGLLLKKFDNGTLSDLTDGAVLEASDPGKRLVFSTDSFVVSPLIFPGGDIGKLSVCGTVNDISMMGGDAKYLSLSLIIEEGLRFDQLELIADSIARTADEAGVSIVTGDTKVVEKGRGDGIYINTSGIGFSDGGIDVSPKRIEAGDAIIVSGNVGDHGACVMLSRNPGLMEAKLRSDCAFLKNEALLLVKALGRDLKCMRDPTRGGLATALNEFIEGRSDIGIELKETDIPVDKTVDAACGMLGLDPLYSACEGRMVAVVKEERAAEALGVLREFPSCANAAVIGQAVSDHAGRLVVRTAFGTGRIMTKLTGEQLPRIC